MIVGIIISAVVTGRKNRENYQNSTLSDADINKVTATPDEAVPATPTVATPDMADDSGADDTETVTGAVTEDAETYEQKVYSAEDDKAAPRFLSFTNEVYLKAGEDFDIHRYIGYADDIDRDVELSFDEFDTKEVGRYPIKVTITDDTEKSTTRDMIVNVVNEIPSGGGDIKFYNWEDFASRYKADDNMIGIDVSTFNGDIDFEKVKEAGCEFVIMRIGGYDNGTLYQDGKFAQNFKNAKAAGLKVGIYWHAEDRNPIEVKNSVAYLMNILDGEELDFPIAYDWEDYMNFEEYGMNLYDFAELLPAFNTEIEKYGYAASLYGSKSYLQDVWTIPEGEPVWLAHYVGNTDYPDSYYMWQLSSIGSIDGVNGFVDLDVYYGES